MGSNPEAVVSAYFDALNRSDAQALASLFQEDGVFMGEGAPPASGHELGPGDAFVIGAGHDAWVLGDEPCVMLDFSGSGRFVVTAAERTQR
jgi:ketosteroid isomerase-like protein